MGTCRLVSLVVLLSTALIELDSSDDIDTLLLSVGVGSGLGVAEGVGTVLELSSVVGNGEGVI
jgi:hypothetical protein